MTPEEIEKLNKRITVLEEMTIKQWKFIDAIIDYLTDKYPDDKIIGIDK